MQGKSTLKNFRVGPEGRSRSPSGNRQLQEDIRPRYCGHRRSQYNLHTCLLALLRRPDRRRQRWLPSPVSLPLESRPGFPDCSADGTEGKNGRDERTRD